tara:strand:+ start:120 stop:611 length:492 start_codon:yes stop_codon:yes gene_type:complete
MKGNLRYRISEKTIHADDVNIDALMHDVEVLYEKKCVENNHVHPNIDACADADADADADDSKDDAQEELELMDSPLDVNTQSEILATSLHYETNINRDKLEQIANYYKITHRKKKKIDLAKDLAIFEHDVSNIQIVDKRKKFWKNIKELKEDEYFKQYISFNI